MRPVFLAALLPLVFAAGSLAQSTPVAAPGLSIPGGSLPWALDRFEGKPELVPIHHSNIEVNNHKGANVAGSLAGSFFYKPKMSTELAGPHARTILHDARPVIYFHLAEDTDGGGGESNTVWALTRANLNKEKDRRIFAQVKFTQLTGNAKRADGVVETTTESLPGGWFRMTPTAALQPGEYAVQPIPKTQNAFSTVVFDFTLDPAGAHVTDAVTPAGS